MIRVTWCFTPHRESFVSKLFQPTVQSLRVKGLPSGEMPQGAGELRINAATILCYARHGPYLVLKPPLDNFIALNQA